VVAQRTGARVRADGYLQARTGRIVKYKVVIGYARRHTNNIGQIDSVVGFPLCFEFKGGAITT
jgi:hypothetical protein